MADMDLFPGLGPQPGRPGATQNTDFGLDLYRAVSERAALAGRCSPRCPCRLFSVPDVLLRLALDLVPDAHQSFVCNLRRRLLRLPTSPSFREMAGIRLSRLDARVGDAQQVQFRFFWRRPAAGGPDDQAFTPTPPESSHGACP